MPAPPLLQPHFHCLRTSIIAGPHLSQCQQFQRTFIVVGPHCPSTFIHRSASFYFPAPQMLHNNHCLSSLTVPASPRSQDLRCPSNSAVTASLLCQNLHFCKTSTFRGSPRLYHIHRCGSTMVSAPPNPHLGTSNVAGPPQSQLF